jgi:hypothetical protein
MGCVLCSDLGNSILPLPRCPSPPCSRSFLPKGCKNPATEDGDSRVYVEGFRVEGFRVEG